MQIDSDIVSEFRRPRGRPRKVRLEDMQSQEKLEKIVDTIADAIGELAARVTNLEVLTHIRRDVTQSIEGVTFPGEFSPGAYSRVKEITRQHIRKPLEDGRRPDIPTNS